MTVPCGKSIVLQIVSSPDHVPVARAAVEKLCQTMGFDDEQAGQVALSLDEALANVIKHAYDGRDGCPIEVTLTPIGDSEPTALRIRLHDCGRYVDPKKIQSRDLSDVRPGGLGVHIIREYMDHVQFEPADGGGTLLTMIKTLKCEESSS